MLRMSSSARPRAQSLSSRRSRFMSHRDRSPPRRSRKRRRSRTSRRNSRRPSKLEAQIEANGNRVSVLDEQFTNAQLAIQNATDQINADEAALDAKQTADRSRCAASSQPARGRALHGRRQPCTAGRRSTSRTPRELGIRSRVRGRGRRLRPPAPRRREGRGRATRDAAEVTGEGPRGRGEAARASSTPTRDADHAGDQASSRRCSRRSRATSRRSSTRSRPSSSASRKPRERDGAGRATQAAAAQAPQQATATTASAVGQLVELADHPRLDRSASDPPAGPNRPAQVAVDTARRSSASPTCTPAPGPDVRLFRAHACTRGPRPGCRSPTTPKRSTSPLPHVDTERPPARRPRVLRVTDPPRRACSSAAAR